MSKSNKIYTRGPRTRCDAVDTGARDGVATTDLQRQQELERENKELRRANEILRQASAFFA